jgi:Ring finger domain
MQALGIRYKPMTGYTNTCMSDMEVARRVLGVCLYSSLAILGLSKLVQRYKSGSNTTASQERLRGDARRRAFQEQRRNMLQRAQELASNRSLTQPADATSTAQPLSFQSIRKQLTETSVNAIESLINACTLAESVGPHNTVTSDGAQASFMSRADSFGRWIMTLHLGWYCVNGRYPSLLFRLGGLSTQASESRLVHAPKSVKILGVLLLTQSTGVAMKTILKWLVKLYIHRKQQFISNNISTSTRTTSSAATVAANPQPRFPERINALRSETHLCGICQRVRQNSACPQACGHVFCWHCLQEWVMTNQEACPLCRKPCRPQTIVPLYNYA